MEIKTKYNIGDEVWFMHNNKIANSRIEYISTLSSKNSKTVIRYEVMLKNYLIIKEGDVFPTKQALIDSL